MALSDTFLSSKSRKPGEEHNDGSGLSIRVGKRRSPWTHRFRNGDGTFLREIIGYYPQMGIAEARRIAGERNERIAKGIPVTQQAAAEPASSMTLRELCCAYERARLREGHRVKTFKYTMQCIRLGLVDWLDLPARNFTRRDLRAARDAMNEGGLTWGNRFLAYTSGMLSWAVEEDLIDVNYARDLRRAPERKRERVLSLDELARLWIAAGSLGQGVSRQNYGRLIRLLILTGQRLNECARLRHGDLLGGIWNQKENKSNRPHRLPLPRQALELLGTGTARELVLPSSTGAKLTDFGSRKEEIDTASGVSNWVIHDLRRSFASHLQELDTSPLTIELLLNHALPGTMMVYLRSKMERQKGEALQLWADRLDKAVVKELAA